MEVIFSDYIKGTVKLAILSTREAVASLIDDVIASPEINKDWRLLTRFGEKSYFVWCQEFFFQDSSPAWAYRQSEKLFFSFLFQKELGRRRRIWTRFDGNGGPILSFHSTYDWRKRRRSRTLIQLSSTQGRSWGVADKKDWESNWNDVRRLNAIGGAAVACVRGKNIVTLSQTYSIAPPATFAFRFDFNFISSLCCSLFIDIKQSAAEIISRPPTPPWRRLELNLSA